MPAMTNKRAKQWDDHKYFISELIKFAKILNRPRYICINQLHSTLENPTEHDSLQCDGDDLVEKQFVDDAFLARTIMNQGSGRRLMAKQTSSIAIQLHCVCL